MSLTMSERPRCVRNLLADFDAVHTDVEPEAAEVGENRENLFVEQLLNSDREAFTARWGFDPKEERPVEGSDWEWERVGAGGGSQQRPVEDGDKEVKAEVQAAEEAEDAPEEELAESEEEVRAER